MTLTAQTRVDRCWLVITGPDMANDDRWDWDRYGAESWQGRSAGFGRGTPMRKWGVGGAGWRPARGYESGYGSPETLRDETFRGRGPRGYRRSDDRILDDVCSLLTEDADVDASEIEVSVQDGEVTLRGTVDSRMAKRWAEDIAEDVLGVVDVHNQLRIERPAESASEPPRMQAESDLERRG